LTPTIRGAITSPWTHRPPLPEHIALHIFLAAFLAGALATLTTWTTRQHVRLWAAPLQLGGNRHLPHQYCITPSPPGRSPRRVAVYDALATRQHRHLPHQRRTTSHLWVGRRSRVTFSQPSNLLPSCKKWLQSSKFQKIPQLYKSLLGNQEYNLCEVVWITSPTLYAIYLSATIFGGSNIYLQKMHIVNYWFQKYSVEMSFSCPFIVYSDVAP
jgi:hypothetical protein